MGQLIPRVELDIRRAVKQSGLTMQQFADATHISVHTLRGMAYAGKLTSIETAYEITRVAKELRIPGPRGTVVMRIEEDPSPPPSSPGGAVAPRRRDAA